MPATAITNLHTPDGNVVAYNPSGTVFLANGPGASITGQPLSYQVTIAAAGGPLSLSYIVTSVSVNPMLANTGYICSAAVNLTLPAAPSVGTVVSALGFNALWTILPAAGQTIYSNYSNITSSGLLSTTTSLAATMPFDSICLVAYSPTQWVPVFQIGAPHYS